MEPQTSHISQQSTESVSTFPAAKSKGISQLHFNAINNATTKNIKYSNGRGDESKKSLLPTQKKYIITPSQQPNSSGSGSSSSATSPQPSTSKSPTNGAGLLQIVSTTSSATPSQRTSPVGSPTYYHRPKHFASMRSVKSGK